jgi:ABC-2 type transport system permease protein
MGPAAKPLGASMGDASTLIGFLHIELFSMILPSALVAFAAGTASGFTAGEESRGTIDILLSYPVSRRRVVLERPAQFRRGRPGGDPAALILPLIHGVTTRFGTG